MDPLWKKKTSDRFYLSINCSAECQRESPVRSYLSCTGEPRLSIPDMCHQGWAEGKEHLSWPADSPLLCADQDVVGFLCYKHALLPNASLVSNRTPRPLSAQVISSWLLPSAYWCLGYSSPDKENIEMEIPMNVLMEKLTALIKFLHTTWQKFCVQ